MINRNRIRASFLLCVLTALGLMPAPQAYGQNVRSGDVIDYIDSLIGEIADATPADLYVQPTAAEQDLWQQIILDMAAGHYADAHAEAAPIDYRVTQFSDLSQSPNRTFYVLERIPGSTTTWWGTFVFNAQPSRPRLVIQSPHPLQNRNTGNQGLRVFHEAGAWAFFVSGTHKCNSTIYTPCTGETSTSCSVDPEPYRNCDQAHSVEGTFQLATEVLLQARPDIIVIQPHGFTKESGDPDLIMSNGTRFTPSDTDWVATLRDNLLLQDNTLTFKVAHIDLSWTKFVGRENVQGRLVNNGSNPCYSFATSTTGRFVHLEQAYSKLRDTEANWYKLANAVALTFPATDQILSVQSGPWRSPSTWANNVIPMASDDVRIEAGHTVSVDDSSSVCRSLSFADTSSHLDMNAYSRLNVYGDFTLAGVTHNVFSAGWSPDSAFVRFVGSEPVQTISGFSTTGGSTSFRNVIVAKDSGTVVTTAGNGMRLGLQQSLDIVSGTLLLADGDDIEGRWTNSGNFTSDQQLEIVIHPEGALRLVDGADWHHVRSGSAAIPIGKMMVFGTVEFYDASSLFISIGGIDVKDGGTIEIGTSLWSSTSGPKFNPGTITLEPGATLLNFSTVQVYFDTSVVVLNSGATYKTSSSVTIFPPTFTEQGTVRYQRTTSDQTVTDRDYQSVEFSFGAETARKLWDLSADRVIDGSLTTNNDAQAVLTAGVPRTLRVDSLLRLTSGILDVSDPEVSLVLADGALVRRATGSLSGVPTCLGVVDVEYTSTMDSVVTGSELPAGAVRNLSILGNKGVRLGGNVTVGGTLLVADTGLSTGSSAVTLGSSGLLDETAGWPVDGVVQTTRPISSGVLEEFGNLGLAVTPSAGVSGSVLVVRTSGSVVGGSGVNSIARSFVVSGGSPAGWTGSLVLAYSERELNGLAEAGLQAFWSSDGTNWTARGGTIDVSANTVTIATPVAIPGQWTLGLPGFCCVMRGDMNNDNKVIVSDLTFLVGYLFKGTSAPACSAHGDLNNDGKTIVSDLTYLVNFLFKAGQAPAGC